MNALRGKSNEIMANSSKFVKEPEAIDFGNYKGKLKFAAAAVSDLEKIYKSTELPTYTADLPAFEAKKRAAMMDVVKSTVSAAKEDLALLNQQLAAFEDSRMSEETTIGDLKQRFPTIAKEVESEIKDHHWLKQINKYGLNI